MSDSSSLLQFEIDVDCQYLPEQSQPEEQQYVFAYTIKITNCGSHGAQLMRRHWIITDANGQRQEVRGDGVIGEQPYIESGASFQYTSGAILKTPLGTMEGQYEMVDDGGESFSTPIPLFSLTKPGILH